MTSIVQDGRLMMVPGALSFPMVGIAPFVKPFGITSDVPLVKARQYFNPNDDPQLRETVIKHFYRKLREVWLESSFVKLLRYIKVQNGTPMPVDSIKEIENNTDRSHDARKIQYVLESIFSKYDMEVLLDKVVMEYMLNWYDLKSKHNDIVKQEVYRKIKHRLVRKL